MADIKYEVKWNPRTDITAYELALCLPHTVSRFQEMDEWDKMPEGITRHFDISEFDYAQMIRDNADKLRGLMK